MMVIVLITDSPKKGNQYLPEDKKAGQNFRFKAEVSLQL
jgi:hypothetical protein